MVFDLGMMMHLSMGATWAHGLAHSSVVIRTPTRGNIGFNFLTNFGKISLTRTPARPCTNFKTNSPKINFPPNGILAWISECALFSVQTQYSRIFQCKLGLCTFEKWEVSSMSYQAQLVLILPGKWTLQVPAPKQTCLWGFLWYLKVARMTISHSSMVIHV